MIDQSNYDNINYFVSTAMIFISTPPYTEIIDNVFNFIETNFIGEKFDIIISMLAERIDYIEDVNSKTRLLRFLQEHRKDDDNGFQCSL